jgi:2-polyprenyl-3-methyl-5-hydroxy-6-metoxy-1,4-benzoquinol methylase
VKRQANGTTCALCTEAAVDVLVEFGDHPIAHRLLSSRDEETYAHAVTLGCCRSCGLSQLVDPIPAELLYGEYNWLSTWKWNPHIPRLLELLDDLDRDSSILEIGSNDGSFLDELRRHGFTRLLGVEPARDAVRAARDRGIETLGRYWDAALADELVAAHGTFDLVIARQVLEHVHDLDAFVTGLRAVLRPGSHLLVEVPDFGFNEWAPDYSAMWEEHVNHFTAVTLRWLLERMGVVIDMLDTACFSGQVLIAYGHYEPSDGEAAPSSFEASFADAQRYADRWPRFRTEFRDYLQTAVDSGHRVAVYGAGCRSSTLINLAGAAPYISCVIDDQEEKQGKFLPGSRLPIISSDCLAASAVDLCLLAVNAENEERVISRHSTYVERGGRFVSLHPPSPRLPDFWRGV